MGSFKDVLLVFLFKSSNIQRTLLNTFPKNYCDTLRKTDFQTTPRLAFVIAQIPKFHLISWCRYIAEKIVSKPGKYDKFWSFTQCVKCFFSVLIFHFYLFTAQMHSNIFTKQMFCAFPQNFHTRKLGGILCGVSQ